MKIFKLIISIGITSVCVFANNVTAEKQMEKINVGEKTPKEITSKWNKYIDGHIIQYHSKSNNNYYSIDDISGKVNYKQYKSVENNVVKKPFKSLKNKGIVKNFNLFLTYKNNEGGESRIDIANKANSVGEANFLFITGLEQAIDLSKRFKGVKIEGLISIENKKTKIYKKVTSILHSKNDIKTATVFFEAQK